MQTPTLKLVLRYGASNAHSTLASLYFIIFLFQQATTTGQAAFCLLSVTTTISTSEHSQKIYEKTISASWISLSSGWLTQAFVVSVWKSVGIENRRGHAIIRLVRDTRCALLIHFLFFFLPFITDPKSAGHRLSPFIIWCQSWGKKTTKKTPLESSEPITRS